MAVHWKISLTKLSFQRKEIPYRKIKSVDKERFKVDIDNSPLMNYSNIDNVTEPTELYNCLQSLSSTRLLKYV